MNAEEATDWVRDYLKHAIDEGEFSGAAMREYEAWERSAPYCGFLVGTHVPSPHFDATQDELAEKAQSDPVWHRAAIITACFFVRRGMALTPSLGELLVNEALNGKPTGKPGRPPKELLFYRDRRILESVETVTRWKNEKTRKKFTQSEAFEIVADALRSLGEQPNSKDGVEKAFLRSRKLRKEEGKNPRPL